jgi:hypothetical protein
MVLTTADPALVAVSLTTLPPSSTMSPVASADAWLTYETLAPALDEGVDVPRSVARATKAMFACIDRPCAKPAGSVKVKRMPTMSASVRARW